MRKRKLNNIKRKINLKIIIFVIVVIFFLILSSTMAKYVFVIQNIQQLESKKFYFNSDISADNENNYYTEMWDGEKELEVNFCVNNYENQNLITSEDIRYSIEVEKINDVNDEITTKIFGDNKEISEEQILTGNVQSIKNYTIKISANKKITSDLVKIKLKINSISPYKKELTSDIDINILNNNNEINSTIIDNGEYVTLKIQTNDYIESKTITYDNTKLILDQSSAVLENISNSTNDAKNSFVIPKANFEKNTNYEIYFIKIDTNINIELGTDIIIN